MGWGEEERETKEKNRKKKKKRKDRKKRNPNQNRKEMVNRADENLSRCMVTSHHTNTNAVNYIDEQ